MITESIGEPRRQSAAFLLLRHLKALNRPHASDAEAAGAFVDLVHVFRS